MSDDKHGAEGAKWVVCVYVRSEDGTCETKQRVVAETRQEEGSWFLVPPRAKGDKGMWLEIGEEDPTETSIRETVQESVECLVCGEHPRGECGHAKPMLDDGDEIVVAVWREEKEEPVVLLPRGGGHTCADNPTIPCANKECEEEARRLNGMRPVEPGKSEETLIRQAILLLEEEDEQDGLGEDASLAISLLHHVEHVREMRKGGAPADGCGLCREELRENSRIGNEVGWTDPYQQKEHD